MEEPDSISKGGDILEQIVRDHKLKEKIESQQRQQYKEGREEEEEEDYEDEEEEEEEKEKRSKFIEHGLKEAAAKNPPAPHPFFQKEEDLSDKKDKSLIRFISKEAHKGNRPDDLSIVQLDVIVRELEGKEILNKKGIEFVLGCGAFPDGFEQCLVGISMGDEAKFTISPQYLTYHVDSKKITFSEEELQRNEAKSKRLDIPINKTIEFQVKLDYVEAMRGRGLRWDEKNEYSLRLKEEGNEYFSHGMYSIALRKYEKGIEFTYDDPSEDVMKILEEMHEDEERRRKPRDKTEKLSKEKEEELKKHRDVIKSQIELNICATKIKRKSFDEALESTNYLIKENPNNVKALYRRGQAKVGLKQYDEAKEDFSTICKLEPDNSEAQKQITKIERLQQEDKKKEKKLYQKMFNDKSAESMQESEKQDENTLQGGSAIERFLISFFTGGVTSQHIQILNGSLFLLVLWAIWLSVYGDVGIHGYVFLFLLFGLIFSLQWVLSMVDVTKKVKQDKKE